MTALLLLRKSVFRFFRRLGKPTFEIIYGVKTVFTCSANLDEIGTV